MRIFSILIFCLVSTGLYAQRNTRATETLPIKAGSSVVPLRYDSGASLIFTNGVKSIPEFPGGKAAMKDYLKKNINLAIPLRNRAPSGIYTVIIKLTVGIDSSLQNIHAESNAGYGMDAEVMRVVSSGPKWKPAETVNNKKVNFAFRLAVSFKIKGQTVEIL